MNTATLRLDGCICRHWSEDDMRYEYQTVTGYSEPEFLALLNRAGGEGWRVLPVTIAMQPAAVGQPGRFTAIMERRSAQADGETDPDRR